MKNLFILLLLVALVAVGYHNREAIMQRFGGSAAEKPPEDSDVSVAPQPTATPHPATEARAAAVRAFPSLGQKESIFNKTFLVLYSQATQSEPELLTKPDWPMTLAKRTSAALAPAAPVATPTPTPRQKLPGSALDMRPGGTPSP